MVKEYKHLCDDEMRVYGVKGHINHKKKKDTQKLKKRLSLTK